MCYNAGRGKIMGMINKLINKEIKEQLTQIKQEVNKAIKQNDIQVLNEAKVILNDFVRYYADELANNVQIGDIVLELNYKIDKAKIRLLHSVDATQYWNDYNSQIK